MDYRSYATLDPSLFTSVRSQNDWVFPLELIMILIVITAACLFIRESIRAAADVLEYLEGFLLNDPAEVVENPETPIQGTGGFMSEDEENEFLEKLETIANLVAEISERSFSFAMSETSLLLPASGAAAEVVKPATPKIVIQEEVPEIPRRYVVSKGMTRRSTQQTEEEIQVPKLDFDSPVRQPESSDILSSQDENGHSDENSVPVADRTFVRKVRRSSRVKNSKKSQRKQLMVVRNVNKESSRRKPGRPRKSNNSSSTGNDPEFRSFKDILAIKESSKANIYDCFIRWDKDDEAEYSWCSQKDLIDAETHVEEFFDLYGKPSKKFRVKFSPDGLQFFTKHPEIAYYRGTSAKKFIPG